MCGGEVLSDPRVTAIAAEISKTPAQVILRWHVIQGRRVFPKSVTHSRIRENAESFNFELTDEQIAVLNSMGGRRLRIGPDPEIFFLM